MAFPVQLYIYDLSNGLAKQMSRQLTGRQIDGIWHSSIVVYGKEVFYGQGIDTTAPGRSHHGAPLQIVDLGETAIDEETFGEYLDEMRDHYTADKYHLLDFNCNSFTNDCAGFLTGGSIPDFVKDLPTDFLSTPFGAALRPTIDAMYRRPSPGAMPAAAPPPAAASALLQAVASQAQGARPPQPQPTPIAATQSLTAPMHPCTNSASFHALLRAHRAVVALFTDIQGCPPCRMIAPVYEQLAEQKGIKVLGGKGAAFTKIDIRVGAGQTLAGEWRVSATPTFMFFLDGKKISELKGADVGELRTQIDLLLFQAYPPHPHATLSLPAMKALSLAPILFKQVPALNTVLIKLSSFIDAVPSTTLKNPDPVKQTLVKSVVPYLRARFPTAETTSGKVPPPGPSATPTLLSAWAAASAVLVRALPVESLFPLVDLWRLAVLDPAVGSWLGVQTTTGNDPISLFIGRARDALGGNQPPGGPSPRNYILTVLRLLANAFSSAALARVLLPRVTEVVVPALLHADAAVRTAAASVAFNAAAALQGARVDGGAGLGGANASANNAGTVNVDEDWEVEMVSAVVESVARETGSEDVVHRLVAALGCLLRFSPIYEAQLSPLLEVLQARTVLRGKLVKGGCGETGVEKKDVRKLVDEVAELCS